MVVRFYSSVAPETTLSSGITGASTSITVGSVTGFPSNTPYTLALDYEGITEELVQVNNAAGTTLTVARAIDGTSAASHNAGARVRHVSSARDFADSRSHENSDQGIHGLAPGDVLVGEDAVQTLTNKTLDSPIINNPNITGTTSIVNASFTGTLQGSSAATAKIRLDNTTDVTPTSTDHAFQIGTNGGVNLRVDNNEVQSVTNGVVSPLTLNADGGQLNVFTSVAADSTVNAMPINGSVQPTNVVIARPTGTSITFSSRQTGDANGRVVARADGQIRWSDGTLATDTSISRQSPGVALIDNSLAITNGLTVPNATVTNLTATGTWTPPLATLAVGTTVLTAAAGWSVSSQTQGYLRNRLFTLHLVLTRTGIDIIASDQTGARPGNVTDQTIGTVTPAWRPSGSLTDRVIVGAGTGFTPATVGYTFATGVVDLLTLSTAGNIQAGDDLHISLVFPQ